MTDDIGQPAGSGHPDADETTGLPPSVMPSALVLMRHAGAMDDIIATIPLTPDAKVKVEKVQLSAGDAPSYVVHVNQSGMSPVTSEERAQSLATGRVAQTGFQSPPPPASPEMEGPKGAKDTKAEEGKAPAKLTDEQKAAAREGKLGGAQA